MTNAPSSPRPWPIAAAPVSWGIFELTADADGVLPTAEAFLDDVVAAGYAGTESGPPGFFGTAGEMRAALASRRLGLAGTFLPYRFTSETFAQDELPELDTALDFMAQAAGEGERPPILLSDAYLDPRRMAVAGRVEDHPETWLDDAGWRTLAGNFSRAAARCAERGFPFAFHYHAGSYVETPREIDTFMRLVEADLARLCFDTGHSCFGGGDPLELLRDYGAQVAHVHLKDVETDVMASLKREGYGLEEAWRRGIFCELGRGSVDVPACLELLRASGYAGWIVVEQDRLPSPDVDAAELRASAARNRDYLRDLGC